MCYVVLFWQILLLNQHVVSSLFIKLCNFGSVVSLCKLRNRRLKQDGVIHFVKPTCVDTPAMLWQVCRHFTLCAVVASCHRGELSVTGLAATCWTSDGGRSRVIKYTTSVISCNAVNSNMETHGLHDYRTLRKITSACKISSFAPSCAMDTHAFAYVHACVYVNLHHD